jgi:aspartyl aminopeptidase
LFCRYVAVLEAAKKLLKSAGYEQISEREDWRLAAGKKYFFTRNYSTMVAFAIGKKYDFVFVFLFFPVFVLIVC